MAMFRTLVFTMLLLLLGFAGAYAAMLVHAPMPFMLGALLASGLSAGFFGGYYPANYVFPPRMRLLFIGVIGVMIGAQVDPKMFTQAGGLLVSLAAVFVFVVVAQISNFAIFSRLAGYDRATAWFAASPGGLIESIAMGEAAGGDVRVMTMLQFLRIILVVTFLPIALSVWLGAPVGSAAGLSLAAPTAGLNLAAPTAGLTAIPLVLILVILGHFLGRVLRLPAGQLTGPLMATACVSLLGWADPAMPAWMPALAQVVLGVHLGMRFHNISGALIARAALMSLISVSVMLILGAVLALVVSQITGIEFVVLGISYAPGGVTEMGLIAVSLAANPALVALHHLFRITVTVLLLSLAMRLRVLGQ